MLHNPYSEDKENSRSKEDWDNEAKECPGINCKDGHISKKDIDFIRSLFELPHCTLLK